MPVPPFVEETFPDVLTKVPAEEVDTDVEIEQLLLAGMLPPLSVITFPPAVPVNVPPH